MIKLLVAGASVVIAITGCSQTELELPALEHKSVSQAQTAVKSNRAIAHGARSAIADVEALVKVGSRVAGTPAMDRARSYLLQEYRQAGYVAKFQNFTYSKFEDIGSNLTINGNKIAGQALNNSVAGNRTAPLVVIPNVGRAADFAKVDVKGAIAIIRRGEIRFLEKAENAVAAGAIGLVIVNTKPENLYGTLGKQVSIPVLALGGDVGKPLLEQVLQQAILAVNTRQRTVTGQNIIAHLPGVTQPQVIIGAHYDSVAKSPGANDNASGTAVVLEIARNAVNTSLTRQAWFVAFDAEENGLHGSRAFVSKAKPKFLQNLKGMLNFDMVGINNQLRVGGTESLTKLAQATNPGVSTFSSRGGSDHASFARAGVPVLFFYRGQEPNYHTPNDKVVIAKLLDETAEVGLNVLQNLLQPNLKAMEENNVLFLSAKEMTAVTLLGMHKN